MKRITLDFETRSTADLRTQGSLKYSEDPTTRATCLAFKVRGESTIYFLDFHLVNTPWKSLPKKLKDLWSGFIRDGAEFSAHNALFETAIYKNVLVKRLGWPDIPFEWFRCTAAKAAACALPRNLQGAGEALKLFYQKDRDGYVAMMATCKPTKQYNAWVTACKDVADGKKVGPKKIRLAKEPPPPMFLEPGSSFEADRIFNTLYTYCKMDVRSEEELDDTLPDLTPEEQEIWFLNQRLNWRGLRVDVPTVKKIVTIMTAESRKKLKQLDHLTMGLVTKPGARKSIFEFLELEGITLPDLRAQTVSDFLKNGEVTGDMKTLLELRQQLSKTSTKKYQAFLERSGKDGRVRDILLYHGASTGRDTGTGVQPHNFPRGLIKLDKSNPYMAVNDVVEHDEEMLRFLYGDSLAVLFSSILRNMIIPSKGKDLFVADFSKIEVAVLWWLAGNEAGLEVLRSGRDPYIYQAAENLDKTYEEIEAAVKLEEQWANDARQLGKAQILGCGFGMGWEKFLKTAWDQYRLKLTDEIAQDAVKNYREANEAVPELWKAYEAAAIKAVETQKVDALVGKCRFIYKKDKRRKCQFLWVELPSGRRLAYADPTIAWRTPEFDVKEYLYKGKWVSKVKDVDLTKLRLKSKMVKKHGQPRKTLEFMGVNPKTKKWTIERTWGGTLTENIVQSCARDLMMPAMVRLEKKGFQALLSVHDEAITEGDKHRTVEEFVKIMTKPPKWATDMPIEAKGWRGERYRK